MSEAYIGMGGNIGDTSTIFKKVFKRLNEIPSISSITPSRYYVTTPVSSINQNLYLNAVCRIQTSLSAEKLLVELQRIETLLGKIAKPKEYPRIIDLDILFFGQETHDKPDLIIPHPKWQERLFVLIPLADLTTSIMFQDRCINISGLIDNLRNKHNERVILWKE
jgi:2-amino-4-hydroxy-6-hydroxymethyldihydropteridine diphosphokinase